ncbi:ABC transporter permease subunit [Sinorhizobium sp. NFACC03]|uniref:ABC transporter permease subunit n=1 Tax=Sinorhizobium sp. NFACC03 TaxID=1566295 RepID=UPI0008927706|nr:ABC transporter permease subunit [Sinorhizobium sp. NFACC03]SDA61945.1 ABC-2 family transporter protein [Sinorhizobium sp. NFACC03]
MEHVRPVFVGLKLSPPGIIRQTMILVLRETAAKFQAIWFWLVATTISLMAYLYGAGFQNTFQTESVVVAADPLAGLNTTVISFLGFVLGLRLAGGLSWEREHGTLEVLLVGPVSWTAIIVSKYFAELVVFVGLMGLYCLYLLLAQPLGAGVISPRSLLSLARSISFVLPIMGLGLLVSASAGSVRSAVVAYLSVVLLLGVYEILLGLLRGMSADEMSLFALYLRASLEGVAPIVHGLSPVAGVGLLIQGVFTQAAPEPAQMVASGLLAMVLLLAARLLARMKGASA